MSSIEGAASPETSSSKATGELKAPTGSLNSKPAAASRFSALRFAAKRGFAVRLAELIVLLSAIIGAIALGLGIGQYFGQHHYVLAYLIAYGMFRLADLLVRDEAALGLDRERFMQRVIYEIPLLILFFAAPFERSYYLSDSPRWLAGLGLLLELSGLWLALGARIQLGFFSPVRNTEGTPVLVRNGLYSFVRHPIYLGELIVLLAWPFEYGALLTFLIAAAIGMLVMQRRIRHEEAELLARFGDDYAQYMRLTDRVIPNLW